MPRNSFKKKFNRLARYTRGLEQAVEGGGKMWKGGKMVYNAIAGGPKISNIKQAYQGGRMIYNGAKQANNSRRKAGNKGFAKQTAVAAGNAVMKNVLAGQQNRVSNSSRRVTNRLHKDLRGGYDNGPYRESTKEGTTILRHTELITPVYATSTTIAPQFVFLSPSSAALNPFSSNMAKGFQKVRVRKMTIVYQGTCGTDVAGTFYCGAQYALADFDITQYSDIQKLTQLQDKMAKSGVPLYQSSYLDIDVKRFPGVENGELQTYAGSFSALQQSNGLETYVGGYLVFAVDGTSGATGNVGNIWITYDYEFLDSQLPVPPNDAYNYVPLDGVQTSTVDVAPYLTPQVIGNISAVPLSTLANDPNGVPIIAFNAPGTYLVTLYITCDGSGLNTLVANPSIYTLPPNICWQISGSTGSVSGFINAAGGNGSQTVMFFITVPDGGSFALQNNGSNTPASFSDFTVSITLLSKGYTPVQNPAPLKAPVHQLGYSPKYLAAAYDHWKNTGKVLPMYTVVPPACRKHTTRMVQKPYFLIEDCDGEDDDEKYPDTPWKESVVNVEQQNRPSDTVSHRSMHSRNGNGNIGLLFLLVLMGVVDCQIWPFYTTTNRPSFNPTSKTPTTRPTTKTPTTTKPPTTSNPTISPTFDTFDYPYTSVHFNGTYLAPFTGYYEKSAKPVMRKVDSASISRSLKYPEDDLYFCFFSVTPCGTENPWVITYNNGSGDFELRDYYVLQTAGRCLAFARFDFAFDNTDKYHVQLAGVTPTNFVGSLFCALVAGNYYPMPDSQYGFSALGDMLAYIY